MEVHVYQKVDMVSIVTITFYNNLTSKIYPGNILARLIRLMSNQRSLGRGGEIQLFLRVTPF